MSSSNLLPFYDELLKDTARISSNFDLRQLSVSLNQLCPENLRLLYAIILHHSQLQGKSNVTPYGSIVSHGRRGVTSNMNNFPLELRNIIYCFLQRVKA